MNQMRSPVQNSRILSTGISKEHFISDEWFKKDIDAIWRPRWHYAAHTSELAVPGSYVVSSLLEEEVIITRTTDMKLNAFYNFCPHRGHRLCTTERGKVNRNFVCTYHGWAYSRDTGDCVSVVRMNEGFDKSPYGLKRAWVEEFRGLVFVSFADVRPPPIEELTRDVPFLRQGIGGYDLSRMKVAGSHHQEVAANWKLVRENDDECYHCAINHPELCRGFNPWAGITVVDDLNSPRHMWTSDEWAMLDMGNLNIHDTCKIPTPRIDHSDGSVFPEYQLFWQPSGHLYVHKEYVWFWLIKPVAPERTILSQQWLVHQDAVEGQDYQLNELTELFTTTMAQDARLCQEMQRGVRMRKYVPGPLNPHHQSPSAAFYAWYERSLNHVADAER